MDGAVNKSHGKTYFLLVVGFIVLGAGLVMDQPFGLLGIFLILYASIPPVWRKLSEAITSTFFVIALMCCNYVNAQGIVGAEKAHNWQDKQFAPDVQNGATHLRVGSGGLMSGIALNPRMGITRGNPSCDLVYLYYIKTGKKLAPAMREECALNEYKLANLWSYEALTALDNSFNKAKVLADFLPQVDARISALSQAKRFYVRAPASVISVDAASMVGKLGFAITDQNWQIGTENASIMVSARGSSYGRYEPLVEFSPMVARLLEEARISNLIDTNRSEVYFDVTSAIPSDYDKRPHLLLIEKVQFRMFYYTKNNEYRSTANF